MKTLRLAFRNILRNKRRTFLTLSAIISGVCSIVILGGFIENTFEVLREQTIRTQLGHIQLYQKGYIEHGVADPAKYLIDHPEKVEAVLQEIPEVRAITQRLTLSGLISTGNKTMSAKVTGIIPEQARFFSTSEKVLEGKQLDERTPKGGVIGNELAKALNAKVGDFLMIMTNTLDGAINIVEFELVGIAQTGSQEYDSVFVKLPISVVQKALETTKVEKIVVLLNETKNVDSVMARLPNLLDKNGLKLEHRSWSDMAVFYHKVVALYKSLFTVIKVIIATIVLFSIINTMTMAVFERTREIGTLRAIGTTRKEIMSLFISEGFLLGVIGGILGLVFGIFAALGINYFGGIHIPPPPGMSRGYTSQISIVPTVLLYAFLLTVTVAVLSSITPAWKASRIKIVEALTFI
ncbi:MAG: ABC transporter permease [Methylococcales bacterium]|nr:ABC transporter permease [Methylococcales bacterium]